MKKLRLGEVESLAEVKWAGLLTWASIPDPALLSTFHSCWQMDEEPRAQLQRPEAWWVIWVGPAHKEL